ncbi:MAG TPA: NAD(P)-dependent oxidoreductase [Flavisolibacter sp.]
MKVLVTSPAHESLVTQLAEAGCDVVYAPAITYDQLSEVIQDAQGLIVTTRITIDRALLDKATALRWIGRLGSGMELIDEAYAEAKGVVCISTPEGNRNAVAEHTLALALDLMNHVSRSFRQVCQGEWLRNENRATELTGKTVGIYGYGNTGAAFARLLQPFHVTVLAYDKYKTGFATGYVHESDPDEIFMKADLVSMHLPLTQETFHLANHDFFSAFRRRPYYISTCRGPVTDTAALVAALQHGQVAAAGLDVLENENISQLAPGDKQLLDTLCAMDNVVITPHVAGYSFEAYQRMADVLIVKLRAYNFLNG